jgi:hypothetical protein
VKGVDASANSSSSNSNSGGLPRASFATLLSKECLTSMAMTEGRESWKGRKASIEDITAACDKSGHYIEANKASADVIKALKARYVYVCMYVYGGIVYVAVLTCCMMSCADMYTRMPQCYVSVLSFLLALPY